MAAPRRQTRWACAPCKSAPTSGAANSSAHQIASGLGQEPRAHVHRPRRVEKLAAQAGDQTDGTLLKIADLMVAEYALRDKNQPLRVAEYQLVESLPAELQTSLPTIEQIERELAAPRPAPQRKKPTRKPEP
jgi:hypothetical protein